MDMFFKFLRSFRKDEEGVTAIEYGLISALIASALVLGVGYVTGGLSSAFQYIQGKIQTAVS